MKKILILLTACLLLMTFGVLSVSGEGEGFDVVITPSEAGSVAAIGTECTFKVSYDNVTAEGGLLASDVDLYFDPAVLQFVSAKGCSLEEWKIDAFLSSTGLVYFRAADDSLANPVTESGKLYFEVTFKVLETTAASTQLAIRKATATTASFDEVNGAKGTLTVNIPQKLPAPTGLTWEGSVAKWDAVAGASGYSVQAYKGGEEVGDPVIATTNSFDFKDTLTESGSYTFTVVAVSDKSEFADSAASAQSASVYTVVGKLASPKIKLTQDLDKGGFEYIITDTNASGTVSGYLVEIFEKGSDTAVVVLENLTAKDGNVLCDGVKIVAGKAYVVTVTAVSADTAKFYNSPASAKTGALTALAKATALKVKTDPALSYIDGEKLNLSGLVVTVTYEDGTTKDVAYKDFSDNGLTTSMKNGAKLAMKNSGKAVTVYYGSTLSAATSALSVKSAVCEHEHQKTQHLDPTCGDAGYDKTVCEDCGDVLSDTLLNATGEHDYGEWVVEFEPTPTINGVKKHTCTLCNKIEYEEIEYAETTEAPVTTAPETEETEETEETDPIVTEESEPLETDPTGGGKTSDLFGVFLVIIIIIFALVVVFIVGGIWLENRRKKARTASRNRRPPNRG